VEKIEKYTLIDSEYHSYDKNCPLVFKKIKQIVTRNTQGVTVEPTGSSAIGVAGKNIIDILVICKDKRYQPILKTLESIGFQKSPFKNVSKKRPLRTGSITYKGKVYLIHAHLTYYDSEDHRNILFFRDYLKSHKFLARKYVAIKRKAIESGRIEATEYNNEKEGFIHNILLKRMKHNL